MALNKMLRTSAEFTAFGLCSGVLYRELSRYYHFDTESTRTQLVTLHTHAFSLGGMFMLILMCLEKNFNLSAQKEFKKFSIAYHSGLGSTLLCMLIQGCLVTSGHEKNFWVSCAAGVGHSLLGVGFFYFYRVLSAAIQAQNPKQK